MKPFNPLLGHNQEKICNILSNFSEHSDTTYKKLRYNDAFRPPNNNNDDGTPPLTTVVKLSLKLIQPTGLNDADKEKKLAFDAVLVREYKDSRLSYDAGEGLKFVEFHGETYTRLWGPTLRSNNANGFRAQTSSFGMEQYKYPGRTILSPEGQVYQKQPMEFVVKGRCCTENEKVLEFLIEITEDREVLEHLKLEWNEKDPIQFLEKEVENESGTKGYRMEYELEQGLQRSEDFGAFGEMQFSMVRLKIRLVKERDETEEKKEKKDADAAAES